MLLIVLVDEQLLIGRSRLVLVSVFVIRCRSSESIASHECFAQRFDHSIGENVAGEVDRWQCVTRLDEKKKDQRKRLKKKHFRCLRS